MTVVVLSVPAMRSTRRPDPDAAKQRLAMLAADIGVAGEPAPSEVPTVPFPGRHAARRERGPALPAVPGLGAPQLTVLAVLVAVGVALTAWWVVRDQAAPVASATTPTMSAAAPLVDLPSGAPAATAASSTSAAGRVTVDVAGKVRHPGIVVLDAGSRVVDAVEAAGGERPGVDLSGLNLARVLVDGEQIVVGTPAVVGSAPPAGGAPSPGAPTAPVNLNTATEAELETLPDVGPVTAQSIVTWRAEHGGFTSVDELLEVDGIGEVTLEKLKPYVAV